VQTLLGRRCYIPGIQDKNPALEGFAERQAINAPLQGTAADIIKRAMIRIHESLEQKNLQGHMLLQIHDELMFEVPAGEVDLTIELVKDIMENVIKLEVPLIVDVGVGLNWAETD